jgi:lipopolysaccharide/colanic/teichoic acid biosynthesis glycosyltransferase
LNSIFSKNSLIERRTASNGWRRSGREREIVPESVFARILCLERKRAERSRRQFLLVLVEAESLLSGSAGDAISAKLIDALLSSTRDTDVTGWYLQNASLGVILTEIDTGNLMGSMNAILVKLNAALLGRLSLAELNRVHLSFHLFPEDSRPHASGAAAADLKLYPDLIERQGAKVLARSIKRTVDILGSAVLLACLSPLLAVIAIAVKLDSKGPVMFRQERLGQYGRPFTLLKFRSMAFRADSKLHEDYVKQFISGNAELNSTANGAGLVYKLTRDPRVTRVGRFLRKTSLDELPQLLNVLTGQMSLVGPRPPLKYEFTSYDVWHRRRVLEAKPGVTGLWQVSGRSRTKFDEMVRLDLQYASTWSLSLDFKILLQTPGAVLFGGGAY